MRSFWSDPYLWVHLSGLAALPVFLELCLLGLATGDPLLPPMVEVALVALIGVTPVLWMQWQRPFSIFSLIAITLKSEHLTAEQRQLLSLFKAQQANRIPIILAAVGLIAILWGVYGIAPIAAAVNPFPPDGRLIGLGVAGIAFFGCNLFLQVPLSVVRVLLTSEEKFAATAPYAIEKVAQDFTLLGLPVNRILPPMQVAPQPVKSDVMPASPGMVTPLDEVSLPLEVAHAVSEETDRSEATDSSED
ncbi:MAG: low-complexity tail membrane protein [Scytolyngbya sp. HA4215-MV1]|jgi:hypothetical protein|nr:low-complexity tail membrane protein [Scytolyngbya sp. HA4215-MV1]